MDILVQTMRKEGFFALWKGMASPLIGIAGVNSLLFTSYAVSKRIISPFPDLSLKEIAAAGAMAGAANAVLASPVEMFKVRMQGQYGSATDKRLRTVVSEMWSQWGFRKGIMRGYWVCPSSSPVSSTSLTNCAGNGCKRDSCICWVSVRYVKSTTKD